jgi:hypothetical protein
LVQILRSGPKTIYLSDKGGTPIMLELQNDLRNEVTVTLAPKSDRFKATPDTGPVPPGRSPLTFKLEVRNPKAVELHVPYPVDVDFSGPGLARTLRKRFSVRVEKERPKRCD